MVQYERLAVLYDHHCNILSCTWLIGPWDTGCKLKLLIFKLMWRRGIPNISCDDNFDWISKDIIDDQSTLVQVMTCLGGITRIDVDHILRRRMVWLSHNDLTHGYINKVRSVAFYIHFLKNRTLYSVTVSIINEMHKHDPCIDVMPNRRQAFDWTKNNPVYR